jgi:hypothetical protein
VYISILVEKEGKEDGICQYKVLCFCGACTWILQGSCVDLELISCRRDAVLGNFFDITMTKHISITLIAQKK